MTTGWNPPGAAVPPGVGLAPPPSTGMPYEPEVGVVRREEAAEREHQHEWAEYDAGNAERKAHEAEGKAHATMDDLKREADEARRHINDAVVELRERLGLDPDAAHAHGPFAPVRRHPFTVAVAAAGAVTATVVTVAVTRSHNRSAKRSAREHARLAAGEALKASRHGGRSARKQLDRAAAAVGSAANRLRPKRRSKLRRFLHV
jgi:hypothetical protein